MNKEQLEYHLNKGNNFGFNTIKNESITGWLIISKQFPVNKFFERFSEQDAPEAFKQQLKIKLEPYNVWIAEIKSAVFDEDRYPNNDDYVLNVNYTFKTLDDVELFLKDLKFGLSQLKWTSEIDFL